MANQRLIGKATPATIGGREYGLRWDRGAMWELAEYPEAQDDPGDDPLKVFRRATLFGFCMLKGEHPFKNPKDLAEALEDDEIEPFYASLGNAMPKGDAEPDPLSESGQPHESGSD